MLILAVDGNKYRNSHLDKVQIVRGLGTLNPKFLKLLPSRFRDSYRRRSEKTVRARNDSLIHDFKKLVSPRHYKTYIHMNSQRLCQNL